VNQTKSSFNRTYDFEIAEFRRGSDDNFSIALNLLEVTIDQNQAKFNNIQSAAHGNWTVCRGVWGKVFEFEVKGNKLLLKLAIQGRVICEL
jgi:hypothetical protein